jgi:S1-C subfamily serine protease
MNQLRILAYVAALALSGCTSADLTRTDWRYTNDDRGLMQSIVRIFALERDSSYGCGTGIVVAGGHGAYIMTAYHVIDSSLKVWAQFENDAGHFPHPLRFIGGDRLFDVAFLAPDRSDPTFNHEPKPLAWGDSRILEEATLRTIEVKYIGYPNGTLMRHIGYVICGNMPGYKIQSPQPSLVMSTAHISSGASGSVLLDGENRILALNLGVVRLSHATTFSIPSNDIRMILDRVERGEPTDHAFIFIDYEDTRDMLREGFQALHIPVPATTGVVITAVADSSTAKMADLRPGDIVVSVDGTSIRTSRDLFRAFQTKLAPGKPTAIRIMRGDAILSKVVMPQPLKSLSSRTP